MRNSQMTMKFKNWLLAWGHEGGGVSVLTLKGHKLSWYHTQNVF